MLISLEFTTVKRMIFKFFFVSTDLLFTLATDCAGKQTCRMQTWAGIM